jgi:hypothetical protein
MKHQQILANPWQKIMMVQNMFLTGPFAVS